jgi:hypothetical protein
MIEHLPPAVKLKITKLAPVKARKHAQPTPHTPRLGRLGPIWPILGKFCKILQNLQK